MAAYLLETIPARVVDDNGDPVPGALLHTYAAGTTTPLATYTNSGGLTSLSNPIEADGDGMWPQIWVSVNSYKLVAKTADDATVLWERDNVVAGGIGLLADPDNQLVAWRTNAAGGVATTVYAKLQEARITPADFSATEGIAATTAIQAWFAACAAGKPGLIPNGTWICNSPLSCDDGSILDIEFETGGVLDLSGASVGSGLAAITVGTDEDGLVELSDIGANVAQFDGSITFSSAPDLSSGDLFILWDDDDYSWMSLALNGRPYYKKGEFCRALSVTGAVVDIEGRTYDSYLTTDNIRIVKLVTSTVRIFGKGEIRVPTANSSNGILIWNGYQCDISGITITGAKRAQIALYRCYGGGGVHHFDSREVEADVGLNYNVLTISCYRLWVRDCNLYATRHCVTLSGGAITASIPNRLCGVADSVVTGGLGGGLALNMHGSCEYCAYEDSQIYGGAEVAGDHSRISGCQIFTSLDSVLYGIGARLTNEQKGANHTLHDVDITVVNAPTGTDAVLHYPIGDALGGTISISDVNITSTIAFDIVGFISLAENNVDKVYLDLKRITYDRRAGMAPNLRITATTTSAYAGIDIADLNGPSIRMADLRTQYVDIDNHACINSINDGLKITLIAHTQVQFVWIRNSLVNRNQNGGIVVMGPGKTEDVYVLLDSNEALSNAKDAGTGADFRTSVTVQDLKQLYMLNNKVGDYYTVQTQQDTVNWRNIELVVDVNNAEISSAPLGKTQSGVTAINTSIPAL